MLVMISDRGMEKSEGEQGGVWRGEGDMTNGCFEWYFPRDRYGREH